MVAVAVPSTERQTSTSEHAGRVAIVTGGAGGIGSAIARRLAVHGALVTVADVSARRDDTKLPLSSVIVDVSDEAQVERLVGDVVARHGRLDYLVHSAAIFPGRQFRELEPAVWARTLSVNLTGTFLAARAALRRMVPRRSGSIVLLSSLLARHGGDDCTHYAASKGGVLGLTRTLALEVAREGVRVNSLSPGITDTAQPRAHLTEAEIARHAEHIPMGRIGRVGDVVEAALFLLSDDSSYLTGQDLRVNGGYPLW